MLYLLYANCQCEAFIQGRGFRGTERPPLNAKPLFKGGGLGGRVVPQIKLSHFLLTHKYSCRSVCLPWAQATALGRL